MYCQVSDHLAGGAYSDFGRRMHYSESGLGVHASTGLRGYAGAYITTRMFGAV